MLKKIITLSTITFLVLLFGFNKTTYAQSEFIQLVDQDSIVISYRWKSMPNTKKQGPLKLDLRIENKSDKSKEVSFVVDVYQGAMTYASSEKQTYCISPNKIVFGDKKYSSFDVTEFKSEDLNKDSITIDLSELEILEIDKCK